MRITTELQQRLRAGEVACTHDRFAVVDKDLHAGVVKQYLQVGQITAPVAVFRLPVAQVVTRQPQQGTVPVQHNGIADVSAEPPLRCQQQLRAIDRQAWRTVGGTLPLLACASQLLQFACRLLVQFAVLQ